MNNTETEMFTNGKLINEEHLGELRKQHRDKKIVFTNGCFDIMHAGHCATLRKASGFGDLLVVGLNSDKSIKILKGKNRPIINEADRIELLVSLEFVDYLVVFDEETPIELIKSLRPDVLAKGSDYSKEEVVGYEFMKSIGGTVELVDLVDSRSTSKIINKIIQIYGNPE